MSIIHSKMIKAIYEDNIVLIRNYFHNGYDMKFMGNSLLFAAALHGNLEILKFFINNGANISAENFKILLLAIESRKLEIVKFLIEEQSIDINIQDGLPLFKACELNEARIIIYLVEKEANIKAKKNSALQWALYNRSNTIIDYLLEKGAELDLNNLIIEN